MCYTTIIMVKALLYLYFNLRAKLFCNWQNFRLLKLNSETWPKLLKPAQTRNLRNLNLLNYLQNFFSFIF
jgi:hypothetical protein